VNNWLSHTPRLDYMEYIDERELALAKISRRRSLAQERLSVKRLEEWQTIREATQAAEAEEDGFLDDQAQRALAVARAALATLTEEEKLADHIVSEAKLRLRAAQDEAESVRRKRLLADKQVGVILNAMESDGVGELPVSHRSPRSLPRPRRPWPLLPSPSSDTSESESNLSAFQSYYDAPSK